jgi:outer membrane protein assembly factor BamB
MLLAALWALALHADWPQYRGDGGRGIGSGDPPIHWDLESGKNVKWKVAIPGLGHSSPVLQADRVFLTTATSSTPQSLKVGMYGSGDSPAETGDRSWELLCLDRSSGKILWQRTAHHGKPRQKRHMKASHANSSPAVNGDHVLAMFGSEGLYCYNLAGELKWKADLGLLHAGPYNAPELEWGFASSPVIHKGQVIMQCDVLNGGFIAILDLQSGRQVRRIPRPQEVTTWSTPAIWQRGDQTQIICNGYKHIGAYDLATGAEVWRLRGGGDIPVPSPFIARNIAYICNAHGRMSPIYAIGPDARGDITPSSERKPPAGIAWWKARGGSYIPSPIVMGEQLYVTGDRGVLSCYHADTGALQYRERVSSDSYSASPVAAAGRLYLTSESGTIDVIATPDFCALARNEMNAICMASPAIDAGQIFIRTRSHLYCLSR